MVPQKFPKLQLGGQQVLLGPFGSGKIPDHDLNSRLSAVYNPAHLYLRINGCTVPFQDPDFPGFIRTCTDKRLQLLPVIRVDPFQKIVIQTAL
ncbi:hypothetical protein D3C73_1430170 [compost metagenome]